MSDPAPDVAPGFPGPVDVELREQVAEYLEHFSDGVLPIVQAGHPVLRTPAAQYTGQLGDLLPTLIEAMRRTMHAAPGVGLAAPQIGLGIALAVIQDPGVEVAEPTDLRERTPLPFQVLVNPRYEGVDVPDPRRSFFEGCLSVSGWQAVVSRHRVVRLTGQDEEGRAIDQVLAGWPARIVQHETDHLHGELYLDRAEIRSLTSDENLSRFWSLSPDPAPAARELGFGLD